jgi:pimeloyl-ACP methyl ester carboxylesterase/DNA-binding CsgD family transcriptional regulator
LRDKVSTVGTENRHIRFCTASDGVRIAYTKCGTGAPIVRAAHWLTHIEFEWDSPVWHPLLAELARERMLVRYDGRGCGLSDRDATDLGFEGWGRDLEAVVDALRLNRFALLGISRGSAIAMAYAVRHPERVSRLVLYGAFTQGSIARTRTPTEREEQEMRIRLAELGWDRDNPAARQMFATLLQPDGTPEQHRSFMEMMRLATSAANAARLLREGAMLDVRDLARKVQCPTLVLHARGDARIPVEEGRELAALIPGARFVPLAGRNHIPMPTEPAWGHFVTEVRGFLAEDAAPSAHANGFAELSAREREILGLLADGLGNRDIAQRLSLSEKTVRNHVNSIFGKLEVKTRAQAIVLAHDAGFRRAAL